MDLSPEDVAAITAAVRRADRSFQKAGGTSRHWMREHFLPELEAAGYRLVRVPAVPASSACTCDETTKTWRPEDRAALCGHLQGCPLAAHP